MATRKFKKETGKWIKFLEDEEIQLLIKPFTMLYLSKLPTENKVTPEFMWEVFDKSLLDWKYLKWEEDDTLIKYNAVNKRKVAEQDMELLMFVFNTAFEESVDEEMVKNLKKSANGEVPKVD